MRNRILAILGAAVVTVGLAVVPAAPAVAAPSIRCGTQSYSVPDGYPGTGLFQSSYVGSFAGFSGTYRIWHYTFAAYGGGVSYRGGAGVKCNANNEETSSVDLTRDTLTASDHPKCGTTSYNVGSDTYTYLGTRTTAGDRFRYWGQVISSGLFLMRGPAAVRCD